MKQKSSIWPCVMDDVFKQDLSPQDKTVQESLYMIHATINWHYTELEVILIPENSLYVYRYWSALVGFFSWCHEAITRNNVDLLWISSPLIHSRRMFILIPNIAIRKFCLKSTYLKWQQHLSVDNMLTLLKRSEYFSSIDYIKYANCWYISNIAD